VTNYFKVWCRETRVHHVVFFEDTSPEETSTAWGQVTGLVRVGSRVSVWSPTRHAGPWRAAPLVGEAGGVVAGL